ncbi:DNA repair protein XRCC1 isoform X2 [Hemiscyllium ocellatum]|uniref:DNA repair protein XRCC1 isoform X2 n=1 Tax=Hemiscyllium ocellatum TaxID=170820 RepID=UPI0029667C0E|nr:DNA repair protein XRCC1 isoform X2 [Hemiscyllium ocellatum]
MASDISLLYRSNAKLVHWPRSWGNGTARGLKESIIPYGTHKADNLLKPDTYRKWKCSDPGEKQVSVILQFEKAEYIHGIDIGNEGSAFVEILVGNSTSACEQDFEVLLVSSFFMSPTESRNGAPLNRVRMFGSEKLAKATLGKKWDRVKVVCTQPYNKNLAYGLSFIRFYSTPQDMEKSAGSSSPKITKLGQFVVKEEEGSNDDLKPGSLFFNRASRPQLGTPAATSTLTASDQPTASYAAAALEASGVTSPSSLSTAKEKPARPGPSAPSAKQPTPGKRKFDFPKERMGSVPVKKESPGGGPEAASKKVSPPLSATKRFKAEASVSAPPVNAGPLSPTLLGPSRKAAGSLPKKGKKHGGASGEPVEFHRILERTVFVLSGFQNPFRSELRDKALEMGAKYRSDWSPDCTHLICAFANTPKYTQVKSQGGCVVRKDWILDCHKKKQRLSHKRYLLDGAESSSEELEEDEEWGGAPTAQPADRKTTPPEGSRKLPAKEHRVTPRPEPPRTSQGHPGASSSSSGQPRPLTPDEDYGGSTDEDLPVPGRSFDGDSGCDTEDELKRVQEYNQKQLQAKEEIDPYAGSTDENTDVEESGAGDLDLPIPELPDLFLGKHFLLYGDFPNDEHRMLSRYITAFNGALEEYMNDSVNYVITAEEWDDRFDEALTENSNLAFVKPRWVYVCNAKQRMVPHQPYVVVPQQ